MSATNNDVFDCANDLNRALARPELDGVQSGQTPSVQGQQACLWLACALGRCRLFGITPEQDGTLPVWIAIAAAHALLRSITSLTEQVKELLQQHEWDCDNDLLPGSCLFQRMDLWACYIAIDEAYEAALADPHAVLGEFRRMVSSLAKATEALDKEMQIDSALLSPPANVFVNSSGNMVDNWRGLLAEPYKSTLPWWLDGSLEI